MAQIRIFSSTLSGFVEYAGNTIGVTTVASSGVISINSLLLPTPAPPGGTVTPLSNWVNAGTSALLTGFSGSSVVKAYLMWCGQSVPDVNGTQASSNNAIKFTDPRGVTTNISPNALWSQDAPFGTLLWITRVQDVTSIVTAAGTGIYTVVGVPSGGNWSGWSLAVVWSNDTLPPRFITVDSYDDINNNSGLNLSISGFITPAAGDVTGRAAMAVGGAESNSSGGGVKFGPTISNQAVLSGPGNPAANFFQCQINNGNSESATVGQLDTTGTWGNNNTPLNSNPLANTRWHYDLTNVSITAGLTNNQRVGIFSFDPAPSPYIIHLVALQVDAQAPSFAPTKFVDKSTASVGESLTYTLVFKNTGNNGTNNAILIDTLPSGVTFEPDSVELNGVKQPGAVITAPTGFNAGAIGVGATTTVRFNATVNNVSTGTVLTNTFSLGYNYNPSNAPTLTFSNNLSANIVNTTVLGTVTISNTKYVNKQYANVGDTLTYTIVIGANGNTSTNSVIFTDTIPTDTTFVPNSFKVNGVTVAGGNPNPPGGVNVGTIANGKVATITFNVVVNTIPNPNPIQNSSTSTGNFTQDPSLPNGASISTNSNIVNTTVNNANLGNIQKSVNKTYATCGDILTYTITVPNNGNVTAISVIIKDTVPNGAVFVPGTVKIDGVSTSYTPNSIVVGTIPASAQSVITFDVKVDC